MSDFSLSALHTQKTPALAASGPREGASVAPDASTMASGRPEIGSMARAGSGGQGSHGSNGAAAGNGGGNAAANPFGNAFGTSPLQSAESFENYCAQVQTRLVEHASRRAHFLQTAYDRLTRLLHTARSVEDTALYNELWQHRVAVRELMDALRQVSAAPAGAAAVPLPSAAVAPAPGLSDGAIDGGAASPAVGSADPFGAASPVAHTPSAGVPTAAAPNVPAAPAGASQPSSDAGAAPAALNRPNSTIGNGTGNTASLPTLPLPALPASALPPKPAPVSLAGGSGHTARSEAAQESGKGLREETAANGANTASVSPPAPFAAKAASAEDIEAEPRPLRHPVRPIADIEADAARLRVSLREWETRMPLRNTYSETNSIEGLNVPHCLRLRAVACRMRRLEEEAGDTEVAEVNELARDIEDILDDAGDEEYTVALDYDIEPLPTAYQWGELAERYEETARAEEAFEWWITHRAMLNVADVQNLAESVAAIQQRFNRLLFRIGARDPFQQQLFDDLRIWAKDAQCYLYSLRPKVPIQELIEKAQTIDEAWEQARIPVRAVEERQQAVESVVNMVTEPRFGEREQEDEQRLQTALLHCKELKIPFSDRRLRDALLPWAAFLEGDERFKELLREINLEWERRQEAGKTEVVEDEPQGALDELRQELEAVRLVTRGKRCLLLGGTCREENRRKIEEALQLSELVWPSTKPSDPLAKFDTELRHSDIVALLTRFSRKEWKNAQDICARDGKRFVHLTTGYGVAQVVRHFYTQIAPRDASH